MMNDWMWLVKTPNVDLSVSVCGPWTQAEAAKLVWQVFEKAGLPPIIGLIPRKRLSTDMGDHGTIYEENGKVGFSAGRAFWVAAGRLVEFEATLVKIRKG